MQQPTIGGGSETASELRSDAREMGNKAANRIHSEVDARKDNAAAQAQSVSTALQRAASELDEGTPTWVRSAFQQGADQIQRFAATLEQNDSRQMLNEVQSFARERPALFLGACAAAGFAAARVFKAGGEQDTQQSWQSRAWDQEQPWGDGGQGSRTSEFGEVASASFVGGGQSGQQRDGFEDDPLVLRPSNELGARPERQAEFGREGDYR
jgi:hypothetical protein